MRVRTWLGLGLALAAGAGAAAWVAASRGERPEGVAILGDAAPALHAALGTEQALPVASAAFTVVSVSAWDRLAYIADMAALCGGACTGEAGLVRAVRLSPRGSRKVVFVNHAAWPGIAGREAPEFGCLARTLAAERGQIGPGAPPACAEPVPLAEGTRWVLPLGLGAL